MSKLDPVLAAGGPGVPVSVSGGNLTWVFIVAIVALLALAVAGLLVREVLAASQGTTRMQEIATAVQEGAAAYLRRQFKTLGVFVFIIFWVLLLLPADGTGVRWGRSIFFLLGAIFSGLTGFTGMSLCVRGNVRVAAAAQQGGERPAMRIAFRCGGVAGMCTVGLGLLGAGVVVLIYRENAPDVLEGFGFGATGHAVGEVCFNTAMTGYQEIMTDPSYAGQIITFTFPHIGNVGTNEEDIETVNLAATPGARGVVLHSAITQPSNYRATRHLDQWLKSRGVIGLAGIDTRALTALIREKGMPNAVIAHEPSGRFDLAGLKREAKAWPGLVGMDLVPMVTSGQRFTWDETPWLWGAGYGRQENAEFHVVAIDYGIKRNILR